MSKFDLTANTPCKSLPIHSQFLNQNLIECRSTYKLYNFKREKLNLLNLAFTLVSLKCEMKFIRKALISISYNKLGLHDLICQAAEIG